MRKRRTAVLLAIVLVAVVAIVEWILWGPGIGDLGVRFESDPAIAPGAPGYEATVQVTSLGVAGWLVRRGDDALMSGPLYTYPRPWRLLGLGRVTPSRDAFDSHAPASEPVKAIIAAHAHYDHALYVPAALEAYPQSHAYGSSTLKHIVAGYGLADRVVSLDAKADTRNGAERGDGCKEWPRQDGAWEAVPGARMRIRAFAHHHAAQVLGVWHLWPGCLDADLTAPPTHAGEWLEGPVFSYLVDFLDESGAPVWRVYYQDSPVDGLSGTVPADIIAEREVDLAFLGVGNWDRTHEPESIVANLRPKNVVLHHWENFFHDPRKSLRQLPLHDGAAYQRIIRAELDALGGERTLTVAAPDVRINLPSAIRAP